MGTMSKAVRKAGGSKAISVVRPRSKTALMTKNIKASGGKVVVRKAAPKTAASHILSAPKGYRTLSHRTVKKAIEEIFEERYGADA